MTLTDPLEGRFVPAGPVVGQARSVQEVGPLRITLEGTLGQLLYSREMYDDVARVINNVEFLTEQLRPIVRDMQTFSNKIARDPSRIGVGGAIRREAPIR